eukprot:721880-Lingulodinium_polyedra.AAC.1
MPRVGWRFLRQETQEHVAAARRDTLDCEDPSRPACHCCYVLARASPVPMPHSTLERSLGAQA